MKSRNVDMGSNSLFLNIVRFSIPFMLTGFLQRFYNAADVAIVGRYAGEVALAGVGSTGSLNTLLVNLVLGLSVGVNVVLGRARGAKDEKSINEIVHTAMFLSVLLGAIVSVVGVFFAEPLLRLTDVPNDVMPQAKIYMQILFMGKIPSFIYNFGSAVLRAKGDTKRPLYIVTVSGIVNVLLNLLFVLKFKMQADGVALATVLSQVCSAVAIIVILCKEEWAGKLDLKKLRINKKQFVDISVVGIPSGLQAAVFSVSNVLVQSSVNSFGTMAVAGNSAAANIGGFYYGFVSVFLHSAMSFISYSIGAKTYKKIKKIVWYCLLCVTIMWSIEVLITILFGKALLGIYAPGNIEVINLGLVRLLYVGCMYGLCGYMEVMIGALRGIGRSFASMIVSIIGTCGIRIMWLLTAFKIIGTFESIYYAMPLSWIGTFLMEAVMFVICYKKLIKKAENNEKGECLDAVRG